jgi:hypothetical protein
MLCRSDGASAAVATEASFLITSVQKVPDTVKLCPPVVYVTVYVSPLVGCAVPVPLICAANVRLVDAPNVCPAAKVY